MSQAFQGIAGVKSSCSFQTILVHILDFQMELTTPMPSSVVQGKVLTLQLKIDDTYIIPLESTQVEVLDSDDLPSSELSALIQDGDLKLVFTSVPKDVARIRLNVPIARVDGQHIAENELDNVNLVVNSDLN